VRVDGIGRHDLGDGRVARTATVQQDDGRAELVRLIVPANFATPEPDDATGALPIALLLAMRLGEDLNISGRVDSTLLARTDDLQAYYLACGGGMLRRVSIRVEGTLDARPRARLAAACLSRGVDSLFQAARRRSAEGELDALVFVDHFEPIHDDAVRASERALAREAASLIGLPLIITEAPLRALADRYFDWEDAVGAGLAWVGHALSGGLGRLVIPASDFVQTLAPCGHGPGLEPLVSSRRMRLEPGDISQSRMGKVAWLAEHRHDLLPFLKVCYRANRPDNCGRCGKCLHTMACLRVAGALEHATGFPSELDLDAFAAQRDGLLSVFLEIAAVRDAAERAGDTELLAAASETLRQSIHSPRVPALHAGTSFRARHSYTVRTLLRGEPGETGEARPERTGPPREVGLMRTIDLRGRRHLHGAGWRPPGALTAELGALMPEGMDATIPLWVLPDGRVATAEVTPVGAQSALGERARYVVWPLIGGGGPRRAMRRALDLGLVRPLGPAVLGGVDAPHGYLYTQPGADRVALWAGEHAVTGDQYTAASADVVVAAGYADPRLLGYLGGRAPFTGRLGEHAAPIIPWA
jgi:hypothetical protein